MSVSRRLAVRCCCDPARLLGYLQVPDNVEVRDGEIVGFVAKPEASVEAALEDAWVVTLRVDLTIATWSRPVRRFGEWWDHSDLAWKSNDTPIETLRRLPGFVEASPAELEADVLAQLRDIGLNV